ncbi:MAG: hypothetical protein RL701_4505 [Pseudomonadota bacterium]
MRTERWADLRVHIVGGTDGKGGGTGPVVVLLHGFGAPGEDLVPLAEALSVPSSVRFVFPEAPLSPPELRAFGGRAWWPLDLFALQRAMAEGGRTFPDTVPEGMPEARAQLIATLDQLERELSVRPEHIVIGGFSQGSMLACDLLLRTTKPYAGLALLSSTLICGHDWPPLMAARKGLPVLMTHGTHDPTLPHERAIKLRDLLQNAGLQVNWVSFPGGHELPRVVLEALHKFIVAQLNV